MPVQETYFDQIVDGKHVRVLKSYDRGLAREVFDAMDETAQRFLTNSMELDEAEVQGTEVSEVAEHVWAELEEAAREDWNKFSYFIVTEKSGSEERQRFVSPDWPTAEAFAKSLL